MKINEKVVTVLIKLIIKLFSLLELNTMPGWAGSSWYFNRYMDAHQIKRNG